MKVEMLEIRDGLEFRQTITHYPESDPLKLMPDWPLDAALRDFRILVPKHSKSWKKPVQRIVDFKYQSDGWWEFVLDCEHSGRLLLGADFATPLATMRCDLCPRVAASPEAKR